MKSNEHHLIVISDLHLGGRPANGADLGFQICPPISCQRLARFIHRLAGGSDLIPDGDTIELVINGDFIDFLAEEPYVPFTRSASDAIEKLRRVIRRCDEGSAPGNRLFPALAEFVGRGNRLTFLLGNHDLELSLPSVRRELVRTLTSDAPARIEFIFDGEAYVVGDVLIEHGNRYDGWNAVEFGALRAYRSSSSRGELPFDFQPPAGSRLVSSVMNPLKTRYRFVDLLKPENETVIPILCALEPALALELNKIAPLWLAMRGASGKPGRVRREETYISDYEAAARPQSPDNPKATSSAADDLDSPDRERARSATEATLKKTLALLSETAVLDQSGQVPINETAIADGVPKWLSSPLSLAKIISSQAAQIRYRLLSRALLAHKEAIATTFELDSRDPPYCTAADLLHANSGARVILFGHTHIAKAIPIGTVGRYLNTGSWCPTMRLPQEFYQNDPDQKTLDRLAEFVSDLKENRLKPWSDLQTNFAHLTISRDGKSRAALCEIEADDNIVTHYGE